MASGTLEAAVPTGAPAGENFHDKFRVGKYIKDTGRPLVPFTNNEMIGQQKSLDRQGNKKEIEGASIGIPKEIRQNFYDSTAGELSQLLLMANSGDPLKREKYDRIINHPAYLPYKLLIDKFSDLKVGSEQAGTPIRSLKESELKHYLMDTREGFVKAYELRWIKIEEQLMAKAKKIGDNLPPPMPEEIENFDINTGAGGKGREAARKLQLFLQKKILTYGRDTPIKVGVVPGLSGGRPLETYGDVAGYLTKLSTELGTLGAIAGTVVGGPGGGVIGGAIGVGLPIGLARVIYAFRNGERVTMTDARNAISEMGKLDPVRQEFAEAMYNVSYQNTRTDRGRILRGEHLADAEASAEMVSARLMEEARMMREAQAALGIPRERRGMGMLNWFSPPEPGSGANGRQKSIGERQFVQTDMPLEVEVARRLKQQLGYRNRVGMWVPCQVETAPGHWVDNNGQFRNRAGIPIPAFNLSELAPNIDEVREQRRRIHRELLAEGIRHDLRVMDEEGIDRLAQLDETIEKRLEAHSATGSVAKELTAEIDARDKLLGQDKEGLQEEVNSLNTITTDIESITKAQGAETKVQNSVREIGRVTHAPGTDLSTILNDVLTDAAGDYSITITHDRITHRIAGIPYQEAFELNEHHNRLADIARSGLPLGSRERQQAVREENEYYERRLQAITAQSNIITEAVGRLTEAREQVNESQSALSNKADRESIRRVTDELEESRDAIEALDFRRGGTVIALDTNALVNEPVDVLLQRINDVNLLSRHPRFRGYFPRGPVGWPPEQNGNRDFRMRVYRAKAEAIAASVQPLIDNPTGEFDDAIDTTVGAAPGDVSGWNIREVDLLVMSTSQLQALFTQRETDIRGSRRIPPGGIPTSAEIADLQRQARLRFQARQQRLQELLNETERTQNDLGGERQRVLEEVAHAPELRLIKKARSRIAKDINEYITSKMTDEDLISELDVTLDPRTAADYEVALGISGAEKFLYERISGYSTDSVEFRNASGAIVSNGSEGALQTAMEYMPPVIMAQLATDFFNFEINIPRGMRGGPYRGRPRTREETWNAARTDIANGVISRTRFAEFMTYVVATYMGARANVA